MPCVSRCGGAVRRSVLASGATHFPPQNRGQRFWPAGGCRIAANRNESRVSPPTGIDTARSNRNLSTTLCFPPVHAIGPGQLPLLTADFRGVGHGGCAPPLLQVRWIPPPLTHTCARSGQAEEMNFAEEAPSAAADSGCKVFVANLPWSITWQDLKDYMRNAGNVIRADTFKDRNGRPKGTGVVEYSSPMEAAHAIQTLHDTELGGRKIVVSAFREVEPREPRAPRPERAVGAPAPGTASASSGRVFVGNLAWEVAWQDLKDHMRQAGNVTRADVLRGADGRSRGCGIVEYETVEEAQNAIDTLNDSMLMGRPIFVREDREPPRARAGQFA